MTRGSLNFIVGNSTMQYQDVTDKRKKQGKVKQIVSIQVITCNVALKIILDSNDSFCKQTVEKKQQCLRIIDKKRKKVSKKEKN